MKINTLYELLRHGVEKFASRTAFDMFNGESVTYAEVGRRAAAVQEALVGAGVKAGDKVALLSSSMPNWGICYLAVTSAGMVAVPILPDFSGPELDMIIAHSEAKALLVSDKLFSKLSKQTIDSLNIVIRTKNLGIIAQHVTATGSTAVPSPDDLAAIIYTSGTTSSPKGVMLTHKAICAQIDMDFGIFPIDETDVFLSVLPLSHTYECSIGLIYAFSKGARVVYLDRQPTASALMPALKAVRPTVMLIVPLIIEKIYRHQVQAKFNSNAFWRTLVGIGFMRRYLHRIAGKKLMKGCGGRVRFLGIGGAKLDTQAEQFMLEAKIPYAIGYGLTETPIILAGGVWSLKDWEDYIDNPEIGKIAFQFGTRPMITKESPISEAWKKVMLHVKKGDVILQRFSPTGFFSSAIKNSFLAKLIDRKNGEIAFKTEADAEFSQPLKISDHKTVFIKPDDMAKANNQINAGLTSIKETPDQTVVFMTPEDWEQMKEDR